MGIPLCRIPTSCFCAVVSNPGCGWCSCVTIRQLIAKDIKKDRLIDPRPATVLVIECLKNFAKEIIADGIGDLVNQTNEPRFL